MSTATLETETPAPPKPLPVGVNNLLTFWWLTIAAATLAAWTFWPYLPTPVTDKDGAMTGFGSGLFWVVLLGILGLGMVVGYTVVKKRSVGLLILKVGAIAGMVFGVVLFVLAGMKLGFGPLFDPVPVFVGALVAMVVLLPLVFGMMTLMTLGSADDITEYFAESAPTVMEGGTGQYVVPAAFTGTGTGSGPALAETLGYHQEAVGAEPAHRQPEAPAYDEAFDAAIEEAVGEAPPEPEGEPAYSETQDLATRPVHPQEVVQFTDLSVTDEHPASQPELADVFPSSPPAGAEEGEIFDFEMSPEEEQEPPPEDEGRKTLRSDG